jgi:hypothetical protein
VLEADVVGVLDVHQRLEDAADVEVAAAELDFGAALLGVGDVLQVHVVEPLAGSRGSTWRRSLSRLGGVADVDAQADARSNFFASFSAS